jgi:hypothetical protein
MSQQTLAWAKAILASSPQRWQFIIDTYPLELLTAQPAPNEWSALECLQHLVDCDRISTPVRLKTFMTGGGFPAFNPADDGSGNTPSIALVAEFAALRAENMLLLENFTEVDLGKEAHHAEYGTVTLSQYLTHLAGHDLMHMVQAEQAIMQPLIKDVGPWIVNYEAHLAKV